MCCFWARRWALVAALALVLAQTAAVSADEAEYLDVWSRGYSRFEIEKTEDGEYAVVAFFTNGVEFDYLGLHATAADLRYNQLTNEAYASGGVALDIGGAVVNCPALELDGRAGTAILRDGVTAVMHGSGLDSVAPLVGMSAPSAPERQEPLNGEASESRLHLSCQQIEIRYPTAEQGPGSLDADLAQVDVRLLGSVLLEDERGWSLRCTEARLSQRGRRLEIPGRFEFSGGARPPADPIVRGHALQLGLVDAERGFGSGRCAGMDVRATVGVAHLTHIEARLYAAVLARAGTVVGTRRQAGQQPISCTARNVTAALYGDRNVDGYIGGGLSVTGGDSEFHADALEFGLRSDGTIVLKQPFVIGLDLASMAGLEPGSVDIPGSSAP